MGDEAREFCGLVGGYGHKYMAEIIRQGIFALQHRGQESGGIVVSNGEKYDERLRGGLINNNFTTEICLKLEGTLGVGHVRYSTEGGSLSPRNIQPLYGDIGEVLYLAHNGNLPDYRTLKQDIHGQRGLFTTTTDSEIAFHYMALSQAVDLEDKVIYACDQLVNGSFCFLILSRDKVIGVRDPRGFKQLKIGKLDRTYLLASETVAFDAVGARYVRDVEPGEVVILDSNGVRSKFLRNKGIVTSECIFDTIYFERPDSKLSLDGITNGLLRFRMGNRLAEEHPVEADVVGSIPDSGNAVAEGFFNRARIEQPWLQYRSIFIRNHYVGRTFILPDPQGRKIEVDLKLNVEESAVKGKRVVVVDDSIVRANTTKGKVESLRAAGAKEVHVRLSCPPLAFPCHYGIDFRKKDELAINRLGSVEGVRKFIGADTLGYLSLDGLLWANSITGKKFCTACFDGNYPTEIESK